MTSIDQKYIMKKIHARKWLEHYMIQHLLLRVAGSKFSIRMYVLLRKYSGEVNETKSCARQSHGDKDKMCDSKQKETI